MDSPAEPARQFGTAAVPGHPGPPQPAHTVVFMPPPQADAAPPQPVSPAPVYPASAVPAPAAAVYPAPPAPAPAVSARAALATSIVPPAAVAAPTRPATAAFPSSTFVDSFSAGPADRAKALLTRGRVLITAVVAVVLLAGGGIAIASGSADQAEGPRWQLPGVGQSSPPGEQSPAAVESRAVSMSATGDIIMGNAASGRLPANGGKGFFDQVKHLFPADLVMGNLEQPITNDTGVGKCGNPPRESCYQFRAPPAYASHLVDAGFHLMNQANNHGRDFGEKGYTNTQEALEAVGLKHTGATDQITVVEAKGVKIAVLGFSSYAGNNSLINLDSARNVVAKAATMADLVVVQVHMGGEGDDKSHVKPGTEMFLGENRGDPMKFSRTVIDAGADLVVGHGPHILRGMEFYQGRLIAYSLGNFAGGGSLQGTGRLGWGGVLHVTLNPDGTFVTGQFRSTIFASSPGLPSADSQLRGLGLVKQLSTQDFGANAAVFSSDGTISTPAG
jgi:poly-gamma-glutamate capsule biosynthesis protein CapA/YwtB (metallophosphatase superfamily)